MAEIFISYSRKDTKFVQRLHDGLAAQGRDIWIDWEDIPPTAEWLQEIQAAIDAAEAIVFVISPDSTTSEICGRELAHAVANNKRLIPVVARDAIEETVPEALARLNWIFCREGEDFDAALASLIAAVDSDLEWVKGHTRLLTRTVEWEGKGSDPSFLLRGNDLQEAEQWLARSGDKDPRPTSLQTEYIIAGRRAATRRQRLLLGGVTVGLCVAIALALIAFFQSQAKERQRQVAVSRQLAVQALGELREGRLDTAVLLGVEALRTRETLEARSSLLTTLENQPRLSTFLHGHAGPLTTLAFRPDGTMLATADREGRVMLWNLAERSGSQLPFEANKPWVGGLSFDPDGRTLTAVTPVGPLSWGTASGRVTESPASEALPEETMVALSPDGKILAGMSGENIIDLRDRATGRLHGKPITVDTLHVTDVVFSPDSGLVAAVDWSGAVGLWNVDTQQSIGPPFVGEGQALEGATEAAYRLTFSPNGRSLATYSGDRTITLWDMETHRQQGSRISIAANVSAVTFAPDGKSLASGDVDGTITLWDVDTHQPLGSAMRAVSSPVLSIAFSADMKLMTSGADDGSVVVWVLEPSTSEPVLKGKGVAFTPDGKNIALGGEDGTVTVVDAASQDTTGTLRVAPGPFLPHRKGTIATLQFSSDGKILAGSDYSGAVHLWDWATQSPLGEPLKVARRVAKTIAFTPDTKFMLTAHVGGEVLLWDVASRTLRGEPIAQDKSGVFRSALSPEGVMVALGMASHGEKPGTVVLKNVATRTTAHTVSLGKNSLVSLVFSPDGRTLAMGTDGGVVLWDLQSQTQIEPILAGDRVQQMAFSPDGRLLAASSHTGIVLWDMAVRRLVGAVGTQGHGWSAIVFSPDGKTLALGSASGSVLLWPADGEAWQERACRLANRNLTCGEWRQYLGDESYRKSCPELSGPEQCE